MPSIEVAHVREQGQDMILVPLDASFDHKTVVQQDQAMAALRLAAIRLGLRGQVAMFWEDPSGTLKFKGPQPWHPFLRSLDMRRILANVNKTLSW